MYVYKTFYWFPNEFFLNIRCLSIILTLSHQKYTREFPEWPNRCQQAPNSFCVKNDCSRQRSTFIHRTQQCTLLLQSCISEPRFVYEICLFMLFLLAFGFLICSSEPPCILRKYFFFLTGLLFETTACEKISYP